MVYSVFYMSIQKANNFMNKKASFDQTYTDLGSIHNIPKVGRKIIYLEMEK